MEDKTAVDVLREARELIAKPGGWTQGVFARTSEGKACPWQASTASCFCALGAVERASAAGNRWHTRNQATDILRSEGIGNIAESISLWNDAPHRTQADVIAAFDAAITKATKDPS